VRRSKRALGEESDLATCANVLSISTATEVLKACSKAGDPDREIREIQGDSGYADTLIDGGDATLFFGFRLLRAASIENCAISARLITLTQKAQPSARRSPIIEILLVIVVTVTIELLGRSSAVAQTYLTR